MGRETVEVSFDDIMSKIKTTIDNCDKKIMIYSKLISIVESWIGKKLSQHFANKVKEVFPDHIVYWEKPQSSYSDFTIGIWEKDNYHDRFRIYLDKNPILQEVTINSLKNSLSNWLQSKQELKLALKRQEKIKLQIIRWNNGVNHLKKLKEEISSDFPSIGYEFTI